MSLNEVPKKVRKELLMRPFTKETQATHKPFMTAKIIERIRKGAEC